MKRPARFSVFGAAFVISAAVLSAWLPVATGAEAPPTTLGAPTSADQARLQLAQAGAPDKPVTYSDAQATRGARLFKNICADCHGDDLRGGLIGGPPLRGSKFEKVFANGTPVSTLFGFISTLMPPDARGQYSPGEYADMVAFILRENGFGSAGASLPTDPNALDHLIVEK